MTKRQELCSKIDSLEQLIKDTEKEIIQVKIELLQVCDDFSTYKEDYEDVVVTHRPKKTERKLIGRMFWTEYFEDEDTGEKIGIDRKMVVREDNKWMI